MHTCVTEWEHSGGGGGCRFNSLPLESAVTARHSQITDLERKGNFHPNFRLTKKGGDGDGRLWTKKACAFLFILMTIAKEWFDISQ